MKKDAGDCEEASTKWFYDSKLNKCRLFVYGGCGGNDNRFDTEAKCRAQCVREYICSFRRVPRSAVVPIPFQALGHCRQLNLSKGHL